MRAAVPAELHEGTEVRFRHSPQLTGILEEAGCALFVSTYQAGQLIAIGVADGQLNLAFRRFDRAMGVAVGSVEVAVGGRAQVWFLADRSELAPGMDPPGRHDRCWLPRASMVTGEIRCHELAWGTDDDGEPELWVVNTLFSCLAGLHPRYSFVPRWRPPFVSGLAAEDRCHLNGLALRRGRPAFVTVMAISDEPAGWREDRMGSGAVLDVASGEVVTAGLAMPHSPRWHRGELFVLNSGMGRLERVDAQSGARDTVALVPGYARGLAFSGRFAFVGLSRIRETAVFGGAPIAAYHSELKCGVGVIDLVSGDTVGTLELVTGVEEIFDVQVVPGARCPTLGPAAGADDHIWVLPGRDEASDRGR